LALSEELVLFLDLFEDLLAIVLIDAHSASNVITEKPQNTQTVFWSRKF